MSSIPTPIARGRGINKHYWTTAQDNVLIEALLELSQNPMWRADCGFKNGYLQQLENTLEAKFPGCGLKASPHNESKVKWFKQKWCAMSDMLSLSGFGWDADNMMIRCEKNVFNEYVQKRNEAVGLFNKPFPHYYTLSDIYGRDRATEANAANADDDEEEIREVDDISMNLEGDSINGPFTEDFVHDISNIPYSNAIPQQADSTPSSSTNKSGKREGKDKTFDKMCSNIGAMVESVAAIIPRLDGLINVLSTSDKDIADLQVKLYEEMSKIEGLGDEQIYDATSILATKHDLLRVFFTLPDYLKKGYVIQMLRRGM